MKDYCSQNNGDCSTCSLSNYGRDCINNEIDVENVKVEIEMHPVEWSNWCEDAKEMNLTGQELLKMVCLFLNEGLIYPDYFQEMAVIPKDIYEKLCVAESLYKERKPIEIESGFENEWIDCLKVIRM